MRELLRALDPLEGGVASGEIDRLRELLVARGVEISAAQLSKIATDLVAAGKLEAVVTEDGTTVYTRPDVLLRAAGVARVLTPRRGRPPSARTRRRSG
jgi:hypothetical protein